jgi:hypothetical protein
MSNKRIAVLGAGVVGFVAARFENLKKWTWSLLYIKFNNLLKLTLLSE